MPRAPSMHHYTSGQIKHTRTCKQKRYRQTHIQAILSAVDVTQRGCFHFSHLCQQLRHTHKHTSSILACLKSLGKKVKWFSMTGPSVKVHSGTHQFVFFLLYLLQTFIINTLQRHKCVFMAYSVTKIKVIWVLLLQEKVLSVKFFDLFLGLFFLL